METDYTKRELDEFFKEISRRFDVQDRKLDRIEVQTTTTNGKVALAFREIEQNKSNINQNWRAIQIATAIFVTVIIPLIGIIYYSVTSTVRDTQRQMQVLINK